MYKKKIFSYIVLLIFVLLGFIILFTTYQKKENSPSFDGLNSVNLENTKLQNTLNKSSYKLVSDVMEPSITKRQVQLPDFVNLVKQVGNTVVNITAESLTPTNEIADPMYELFKHFAPDLSDRFGDKMPDRPFLGQGAVPKKAMGSGFIISDDGYILTNAHVVLDAKKIIVKTVNKEELLAKLIGIDKKTDIALIKVEKRGLPVVKIGNPAKLEVGEWVAAIGAPFGFDNSVTQGIVSAKGRSLPSDTYVPFIQTDVPINPGNSGGPLFNLDGEVVGINSQIYSRSGGYMGLSFSIPIDLAIKIAGQLKQYGKVSHGGLGVQVQMLTKEMAESFGLKEASGALVAYVMPNSGAAKAGILVGDIILKAGNKKINDMSELPIVVANLKSGEVMPITIFRSGKEITLNVRLSELNSDNSDIISSDDVSNNANKNEVLTIDKFGLSLKMIDKNSNNSSGVVVVSSNKIAAMAGIMPNDIILKINNKDIKSLNDCKILLNKNNVSLLVSRMNQQMFINLNIN